MMNTSIDQMRTAHNKPAESIRNKARTQAHLSQAEVAKIMGTTQSVVSQIERGQNISVNTLVRYATGCGKRVKVTVV